MTRTGNVHDQGYSHHRSRYDHYHATTPKEDKTVKREKSNATCSRCSQPFDAKEMAINALAGHTPDQCIAALKEFNERLELQLKNQIERTRLYATKWTELLITEIEHDLEEGVIFYEDLEPHLSALAALLKKA